MFTGSTLGPVSELALGSWARKGRPSPDSSWPFSTKVLCHSYTPSLAAGLSFSLGICTIWGAGFSMWEPLFFFFLYRGNWVFFREPYLVPPFLFFFLNLCKRLQPPSSPGMPWGCPPPAAWARGSRISQREGMCQFSNPAKVGVCVLEGKGKAGGLLPFAVGLKRVGLRLGKCHFWQTWKIPNKSFCLLVVSRPGH